MPGLGEGVINATSNVAACLIVGMLLERIQKKLDGYNYDFVNRPENSYRQRVNAEKSSVSEQTKSNKKDLYDSQLMPNPASALLSERVHSYRKLPKKTHFELVTAFIKSCATEGGVIIEDNHKQIACLEVIKDFYSNPIGCLGVLYLDYLNRTIRNNKEKELAKAESSFFDKLTARNEQPLIIARL